MTVDTVPFVIWLVIMAPLVAWIVCAAMAALRDRFGDYPRGTRWAVRAGRRPAAAVKRAAVRVFYGNDKQQKETRA